MNKIRVSWNIIEKFYINGLAINIDDFIIDILTNKIWNKSMKPFLQIFKAHLYEIHRL